jgi:hypothetical protein
MGITQSLRRTMKTAYNVLLFAFTALILSSCANGSPEGAAYDAASVPATTSPAEAYTADTVGAVLSLANPARKVLRTADLRCRVRDAYAAASALENTVQAIGGAITESRLEATETSTKEVAHGEDSLKQVRTFTTTAHLTLRVPVAQLDSVVRLVPQEALFLHHRTLAQEDATLRYLSSELKNKTTDHTHEALAKAHRTGEVITASEYEDNRAERSIDRRIQNLDILDRAAFATLTVEYYQPQSVDAQVVVNLESAARTPPGARMGLAFRNGWRGMEGLLVALIALWPLWLLTVAGVMLYRAVRRGTFARTVVPKS